MTIPRWARERRYAARAPAAEIVDEVTAGARGS